MDALSPNTSALLAYLESTQDTSFNFNQNMQNVKTQPSSLPPSAFFNPPGQMRITPEDTPESSLGAASQSPEGRRQAVITSESDGEGASFRKDGKGRQDSFVNPMHKRKAGHEHTVQEQDDDDDDSGSDDPNGHEDKRAHGNDKAGGGASGSGRRGGRKSNGEGGGKEVNKAAKRKEQNRAAQKAFRERREAKVKDLEDQINALETKSFGAAAENENLRGILKRLQEENVALKQAAFTFTMPVTGNSTPTNASPSVPKPKAQRPKNPSPPNSDENLRSINEVPDLIHRSSSGTVDSPESLVSASSGSGLSSASNPGSINQSFDTAEMFNAYAMGVRPEWSKDLPNNQAITAAALGIPQIHQQPNEPSPSTDPFAAFSSANTSFSPLSPTGSSKAELDALWASFYPNGTSSILPPQNTAGIAPQPPMPAVIPQSNQSTSFNQRPSWNNNTTQATPYSAGSFSGFNPADKMAFRDGPSSTLPVPPTQTSGGSDWSSLNDDSINDFLNSLSGGNQQDQSADVSYDFGQEDDFNAQLQQLLDQSGGGASPSAAFNLSPNAFSPTNYLNMSPSPNVSGSASNSQSPANYGTTRQSSLSSGASNSASPDSMTSHPSVSTAPSSVGDQPILMGQQGPIKPGDVVHVVGPDGKVLKPSELWLLMGMQNNQKASSLVIDDLCEQMKSKATCNDGAYQIQLADAKHLFESKDKGYMWGGAR